MRGSFWFRPRYLGPWATKKNKKKLPQRMPGGRLALGKHLTVPHRRRAREQDAMPRLGAMRQNPYLSGVVLNGKEVDGRFKIPCAKS